MESKKKLSVLILTSLIIVIIFFYLSIKAGQNKIIMKSDIILMDASMSQKRLNAMAGEQMQDDKEYEESIEKDLREHRRFIPKEAYSSIVDAYSIYQSVHSYMTVREVEQKNDEYKKSINRAKFILGD